MRTKKVLARLRAFESPNVTFIEGDGSWPIVWERARGTHVWDLEGRKYLDLTAAFGVAATGHANPRVVTVGRRQMGTLLHAMGDVHPHALKANLARELSRLTFERWECGTGGNKRASGKTVFCNSGFEAVEAALKTAMLATGKPGVVAFSGAYHGLGYGALNATSRDFFRAPFRSQLGQFGHFVPFPRATASSSVIQRRSKQRSGKSSEQIASLSEIENEIRRLFDQHQIGAVLVEPIQVRGGLIIPPPDFLPRLRRLCDEEQVLLIFDEIYTGFGRTGRWFACEHSRTIPDLVCLGKALTGGFPLSACVGRAEVMDAAWPPSKGEAIHTSTFLGHPVGCAMALAQLEEIRTRKLVAASAARGRVLLSRLNELEHATNRLKVCARGIGLLAGIELISLDGRPATQSALTLIKRMLHRGYILLPEGEYSNVLGLTPPLTITTRELDSAVDTLRELLEDEMIMQPNKKRSHG